MLRIGRLTDYGTMILGHLASHHIDLVTVGNGNQHIGVVCTGA